MAAASSWSDLARDALPAVSALVGVLVGWLAGRGREKRDARRLAYIEWLRAARALARWPEGEPEPQGGQVQLPHRRTRDRLNEATSELELVASDEVRRAAGAYLDKLSDAHFVQAMAAPGIGSMGQATDRFEQVMAPERRAVVAAMRRDLGTKR
jgi:hypothetical protein